MSLMAKKYYKGKKGRIIRAKKGRIIRARSFLKYLIRSLGHHSQPPPLKYAIYFYMNEGVWDQWKQVEDEYIASLITRANCLTNTNRSHPSSKEPRCQDTLS